MAFRNFTNYSTFSVPQIQGAKGGKGGLGNIHFKSSINRAPRQCTKGEPGEEFELYLELKVLADVGLLGMPNAGKSTFIRSVSAAKPKVADYPFTTLHPNLGVVRVGENQSFVIADIPGLIEGASEGAGLGLNFLKHISRTGHLLILLDPQNPERSVDEQLTVLLNELKTYDPNLLKKTIWIALNKKDTLSPEDESNLANVLSKTIGDLDLQCQGVISISGFTGNQR